MGASRARKRQLAIARASRSFSKTPTQNEENTCPASASSTNHVKKLEKQVSSLKKDLRNALSREKRHNDAKDSWKKQKKDWGNEKLGERSSGDP
ncbi:hypothetical protein VNI00_002886 [Paramarasmius palmivorus]|uniref:Uncharacterized protein n=1 Tax=Paramarasmius palmivorus TaxID=297713 RepID=A0AAW0DWH0_9AGAR